MKIRPVILCGGSGTRLWQKAKNNPVKQFIDFGGWNLFEKTLNPEKMSVMSLPKKRLTKFEKNLLPIT